MKDDTISRQAAIDALDCINGVEEVLRSLPTIEPSTNCSEIPNSSDAINRQDALDALDKRFDNIPMEQTAEILKLRKDLRALPTIQPVAADTNVGNNSVIPNSSDCISRQAVLDICANAIDLWHGRLVGGALVAVRDKIAELTPAEPKTGRWIYCEDTTADCVDGYRCDQCGLFVPWDYQHKSIDYIKDYNFCPNCGAKMEE